MSTWNTTPIPPKWGAKLDLNTVLFVEYENIDCGVFNSRNRHKVHGCYEVVGWDVYNESQVPDKPSNTKGIVIQHVRFGNVMVLPLGHPVLKSKRATQEQVKAEAEREIALQKSKMEEELARLRNRYTLLETP